MLLPSTASTELAIASEVEMNQQLIKSTGPTLRQIDSYAGGLSGSNDRAMIMKKTSSWAAQLYSQWTTLSEDVPLFDEATVADLTAEIDPECSSSRLHHQVVTIDKEPYCPRATRGGARGFEHTF